MLARFAPVAEAVFATLKPNDDNGKADVAAALAQFETWYAQTHTTRYGLCSSMTFRRRRASISERIAALSRLWKVPGRQGISGATCAGASLKLSDKTFAVS